MYAKGDIVLVSYPFTDLSRTKRRPALVLSGRRINQTTDYVLMQITSQLLSDGLFVSLTAEAFGGKPLPKQSSLRLHKLFTANESLILGRITRVTPRFRQGVVARLLALLR